MTSNNCFR